MPPHIFVCTKVNYLHVCLRKPADIAEWNIVNVMSKGFCHSIKATNKNGGLKMKKTINMLSVVLAFTLSVIGSANAATFHSGFITSDETWTIVGNPHIIESLTVVQNNATLTIEPGVEVRFNKEAVNPRLIIGETTPGRLIAQGTDTEKIIFTSNEASPQPGDWANIVLRPNDPDSIIENAIIEYGGRGTGTTQGSIYISGSSPTIRNCTVRYSSDTGISVYESTAEISNCVIEENTGYGLRCDAFSGVLDGNLFARNGSFPIYLYPRQSPNPTVNIANAFDSNSPNQIYLDGGGSITSDYTLLNFGIPYFLPGLTVVQNNATLTIEPGVEVRFNKEAVNPRLIIGETTPGRLIAQGTDTEKIIFTSNEASPQPGDWANIVLRPNDPDSIIENAIIEYGGISPLQGSIYISGSSPTIRNCIVRRSLDAGIGISGSSSAEISCCDITENEVGINSWASSGTPNLANNNILGNSSYGIYNSTTSITLNAINNWWGDASGPGGVGPGSGDPVSSSVDYEPWLVAPSACTLPIRADFVGDTVTGVEDLTVLFTDRSTSPEGVMSWAWDFNGDDVIDSVQQNPMFNYETPGNYTVVLTAYEADGDYDTAVKEQYITVEESKPIAAFTATPLVGTTPHEVYFSDNSQSSGSDVLVQWEWDFDSDGIIDSMSQNPIWTYNDAGTYSVTLTVTDEDSDDDVAMKEDYITVLPAEEQCTDTDGDGYGVCPDCGIDHGCTYDGDDCNDDNRHVNPGMNEFNKKQCSDGLDNDCDGLVDAEDFECGGGSSTEICDNGIDDDADGKVDCADRDCRKDPACGVEGKGKTCFDGSDNDNDGLVDCADPDCFTNRKCR